ncbi:SDR family oxidoreductase [Hymenobacter sp. BT664]|uniref:SDR family oxidoreductase n=1 Tax=Hymenobacter montanus TaxID=2771359 RepID=A0A927BAR0_9BACT|nr:SDR family NAD(P)-dependent oxidoreductase [Hymenobacter montanus]MBD2766845.1 SDR family oxidoreductase [Hymenobacter montanus]
MNPSGNIVLLTGATSGIGLALTSHFLRHGNTVVAVGRRLDALAALQAAHPNTLYVRACDLAQRAQVDELVHYLEREHPDLNVLINNAAVQYNYDLLEGEDVVFRTEHEVQINLLAPLRLIGLLLPGLAAQPRAAIVNVSSGLAFAPKRSAPVYCATKAGLHVFTQALRYQLEATRIGVFEIIPPLVDTPMTAGRGQGKLTPEAVVAEFWPNFVRNRWESNIGKVKLLRGLLRLAPRLARRLLKTS